MLDTSSTCWTPSPYGGCLLICLTPQLIGWIPCTSVCFREYLYVIWGILPLCWGFGGISISVKLWCLAVHPLGVLYALSCTFLVAHYVAHVCHSYDYYSSGYSGVFWSVIYFISDHDPFLGGASCNIGLA